MAAPQNPSREVNLGLAALRVLLIYPATEPQREKIPLESYESGGGRRIQQDGLKRSRTQSLHKDSRDLEMCVVCKNMYKKGRGLKIHQTKSGCSKRISHRRNKSEATGTQDSNHSDASGHVEFGTTPFTGVQSRGKDKQKSNQGNKAVSSSTIKGQKRGKRSQETVLNVHIDKDLYKDIQGETKKDKTENTPDIRNWFKSTEPATMKIDNVQSSSNTDQMYAENIRTIELSEDNVDRLGTETVDLTKSSNLEDSTRTADVAHTAENSENSAVEKATEVIDLTDVLPETEIDERTVKHKETQEEKCCVDLTAISPEAQQDERRGNYKKDLNISLEAEEDERRVKHEQSGNDVREVVHRKVEILRKVADIRRGKGKEVISKHGFGLTRRDYRSLSGTNYLNDRIIDQYLKHIAERNQADPDLPKVYASTTFLYTKLDLRGMDQGMKETSDWFKEDLREKQLIFFPIHKLHHWSLIVVDTATKVINYLDSLEGSRATSSAPRTMKSFIERYYRERGEEAVFEIRIRQDAPVQENGVDCGVFVCQYAERMARSSPLNFTQADLRGAREKMTEELLEGKISQDWNRRRAHDTRDRMTMKGMPKGKKEKANTVQKDKRRGKDVKKPNLEQRHKTAKTDGKERKENPARMDQEKKPEKKPKEPNKGDKKEKLNWPKSNSPEWKSLDDDLTSYLKILISSPEKKAETHPFLIYNICRERFGIKETKKRSERSGPSKRQRQCKELRKEINILKETYKNSPEEEKEAVNQLQQEKIRELRLKKRAESLKNNRKKFSKNCREFLSQPFGFAREVIAPKPKGEMKSTKVEVEQQLQRSHSDEEKSKAREAPEDLIQYEEPEVEFDNKMPSWSEFNKRLRKTRSKSAPGPNGVPYLVYKRCPGVARLLWSYIKGMWKKNLISDSWRKAEGVFIPKEDGATAVEKFRTISLMNVEGKLYFALKADRLLKYTLQNQYIDTSIQKGGVPAISGCLEHTAILSQLIREAKAEKKDLVVTWLDIANAYGSIPHSLIQLALRRAHVPEETCKLVESYYANVEIRFTTKEFTTDWQRVEKGIITGCTLSVILFALSMTMLVMSVKEETKGPKTSSGQRQVNARLFMDDIATTTENLVQTKYLLDKLVAKLTWAGLAVKPGKCRSLVIIKGEVSQRTPKIEGKPITSVIEKPVKYLGKVYNKTLHDREQTEDVMKELKQGLSRIQKAKIPGRYKAWMVQHMLLPRLMWPLTIYNIPETKVEEMQRLITVWLKRWLGLPRSLSVECFYSRSTKMQLPYSELTEEVKVAKARVYTTFEESSDPCVRGAQVNLDGGRKADTPRSVNDAKSRLKMVEITGIPNKGKEGLGLNPRKYYSSSGKKERRTMVIEKVREAEEDRRQVKMTNLAKQGAQTRWEVPAKKMSHREIINRSETSFKFLVKAVYDLLPTPANKNIWFGSEESCKLCEGKGTLTHILSGCPVALAQGRYRWRHDEVLREVARCVKAKVESHKMQAKSQKESIKFLREGETMTPQEKKFQDSYLDGASDWKLMVDLDRNLKFPKEVAETNQRPDMILMSSSTKRIGLIELTVPSEERIEVSGELKKARYAPLQEQGKANGWRVQIWAIEVGCKGFPAASMASFLKDIGLTGSERTQSLKIIGEIAENASRRVWNWSHFAEWGNREVR